MRLVSALPMAEDEAKDQIQRTKLDLTPALST
jgi:hypothetical protein